MTATVLASLDHYRDHLAPIGSLLHPGADTDVALVAGYADLVTARRSGYRRFVMAQHGAGQSYSSDHPHYPGGKDHDDVGLFLAPNDFSADRWRRAYPQTPVVTVGCPKLDTLPGRAPGPGPVVALAFHWDLYLVPESRSALAWYLEALPVLARRFEVIGTGHPRRRDLARVYAKAGIEWVPDFAEVCRRADVLAFDNTSVGYEFAATGRPVVVLDAPWYRAEVAHGLRFWDAADVGVRVASPGDLVPAVERALANDADDIYPREAALDIVYAYRHGAAARAAEAIAAWV